MTSTSSLTTYLANTLRQAPIDGGLALIFPGQGSQQAGMGSDLYEASAAAREVFERGDAVMERDLIRLCFQGPEDELRQTANAQPAILVTSLACLAAALESGALNRRPAFLAGHSLGEYTALIAAASLTFEDGVRLVSERGRLMQEAGSAQPGAMAAILGLSNDEIDELCRLSGAEPCNYNSPSQIVIGGAPEAIAQASALAGERGGRVLPLNVSGAFHTSLMQAAAGEFGRAVDQVPIADPVIPVVGNVSGRPMARAEEVKAELKQQLMSPVLWHQSVSAMVEGGVGVFVEVGPGRVLSSLMRRTAPNVKTVSIDGAAALPSLSNV